jgi:hypothetical protein
LLLLHYNGWELTQLLLLLPHVTFGTNVSFFLVSLFPASAAATFARTAGVSFWLPNFVLQKCGVQYF